MHANNPEPRDSSLPELDPETLQLAQELFELVRAGKDSARLAGLLDLGLPPNLRDSKGDSLLMLASYHGHHDMTRLLLQRGGDPQLANDRGQIPLAGAAFKGDVEIAKLLIEHGAQIDACGPDGKTPLMFAAMFNRIEVLDLLLAHGADPEHRTPDGISALGIAQAMGAKDTSARLASLLEN
jgi:ankyrin repeat protein